MKILKYWVIVWLLLTSFIGNAAEVAWIGDSQLNLDEHMEFTVTDSDTLVGDEKWLSHDKKLSRSKEQYLHFRVSIQNRQSIEHSLWLVLPFPAIKHITVTDGLNTWVTGDALNFSTRPVESPDYIFPVHLKANQSTQLSGFMQGEILRYSFTLNTPEQVTALYRHNVMRDMAFFGAMSTLVIVSLIIFLATKYYSYLSFAVFTFAFGAWFFRVFGYGFELIWPNYPQINDISYGLLLYSVMVSSSWLTISLLKRQDKKVAFQNIVMAYTALLMISGLFSALFLDLNTTLVIPLYWFFPSVLLAFFITYKEFSAGSVKALWFIFAMLPFSISSAIVVAIALGLNIPVDPIGSLMLGLVSTCLLLTVMISTYLIKLLQSQRDLEQQQAYALEKLVNERTQALEASNQLLQELASKDPLTKLPNRRSLDLFVDDCIEHNAKTIGIALLDLDHFKRVNDTYGHDVGDIVLCQIAALLQPLNTADCIAGRFGGEEFAIIQRLPEKSVFAATLKALHLRVNQIVIPNYESIEVRACIGWVISEEDETISDCFRRADKRLYQAKDQGRNQLVP
ncbi:diguanylate cyclase [uncultured Paraglaciecola sp.]|uniref:diguanylate cyclase n=1 Tax=uncultured Paraglaciecola sp. TaxID=1765024 RepID=UPI0030D7F31F